jgi:uridine kinase/predicted membrane protein
MKLRKSIVNITLTAMFIAIGLLMPFLTGQIPQIGSALLPMHIPVLLCGIFCGPWYGLVCGAITPLFRNLLFGMPPLFPTAIAMAFELAAYGVLIGIFYKLFKKNILGLYLSLISAMIGGRVVWGAVTAILLSGGENPLTAKAFIAGAVTNAIPGIILQLILIPALVLAVQHIFYVRTGDTGGYNEIRDLVRHQLAIYPKSNGIDILKAIYQNEFGPGHMITDPVHSLRRIKDELAELTDTDNTKDKNNLTENDNFADIIEPIGNNLARLHIRTLPMTGLSAETYQKFFQLTAVHPRGSRDSFLRKAAVLERLCKEKAVDFSAEAVNSAIQMWESGGGGLFRHSDTFRKNYKPAYRVVEKPFCDYLDVFVWIDKIKNKIHKPCIIAIDGRSGAGKTTLAAILKLVYECDVIPMDHFFPPEGQPEDANIDSERFKNEVLTPLKDGKPFFYKPYDCAAKAFGEPIEVTPGDIVIIEGSYSCYPPFAEYYDMKVFLSITPEEQLRRIKARNPEMAETFKKKWIPLEESYFDKYGIEERADIIYKS